MWNYATRGDVISSPTIWEGTVYVGSRDHNLYALDAGEGRLLWAYESDGPITSSPAAAGEHVYFGSKDEHLYAVSTDTGELVWRFAVLGEVTSSPTITDETIFFFGLFDYLYAMDIDRNLHLLNPVFCRAELSLQLDQLSKQVISHPADGKDEKYLQEQDIQRPEPGYPENCQSDENQKPGCHPQDGWRPGCIWNRFTAGIHKPHFTRVLNIFLLEKTELQPCGRDIIRILKDDHGANIGDDLPDLLFIQQSSPARHNRAERLH